jgi:hypothetical protein
MYRCVKKLQLQFDAEEDDQREKEAFCLYFIEVLLKLMKYHGYLFGANGGIKTSELTSSVSCSRQ